jgi:hypothetical protein
VFGFAAETVISLPPFHLLRSRSGWAYGIILPASNFSHLLDFWPLTRK